MTRAWFKESDKYYTKVFKNEDAAKRYAEKNDNIKLIGFVNIKHR